MTLLRVQMYRNSGATFGGSRKLDSHIYIKQLFASRSTHNFHGNHYVFIVNWAEEHVKSFSFTPYRHSFFRWNLWSSLLILIHNFSMQSDNANRKWRNFRFFWLVSRNKRSFGVAWCYKMLSDFSKSCLSCWWLASIRSPLSSLWLLLLLSWVHKMYSLFAITFVICHSLPSIMCRYVCVHVRVCVRVDTRISKCACIWMLWGCERGLIPILQRFNTLQRVNQSHNVNMYVRHAQTQSNHKSESTSTQSIHLNHVRWANSNCTNKIK